MSTPHVLVCPLDWGLGHATRCVPVIQQLLDMQCRVSIAGCGPSLELLRLEFPTLTTFTIASYDIKYSAWKPFMLQMVYRAPRMLAAVSKEHKQIKKIVEEENVTHIISDNRYGCYHSEIPSAIITHQLTLQFPWKMKALSAAPQTMNERMIRKFTKCWVPDTPDHLLSGALSTSETIDHRFVGPLTRMIPGTSSPSIRYLALLSGPEPHRSSFEQDVVRQLKASGKTYRVVRGLPKADEEPFEHSFNHLPTKELQALIESCEVIISRSGYSTVMDLAALKKKAIFVPTTGQTEQIYLAEMFEKKKIAPTMSQRTFDLEKMAASLGDYSGFAGIEENNLLFRTLRKFLQ
jgi:Glycosyltransferase family 28 C-terminal domain